MANVVSFCWNQKQGAEAKNLETRVMGARTMMLGPDIQIC